MHRRMMMVQLMAWLRAWRKAEERYLAEEALLDWLYNMAGLTGCTLAITVALVLVSLLIVSKLQGG